MKKLKYLTLLLVIFFAVSCNNDITNSRQKDTAKTGKILTNKLINTYLSLKDLSYFYDYKSRYIEILTSSSDENFEQIDFEFESENLDTIIALLKYMNKTYTAYELLSDIKIGLKKSNIREKVEIACEKLNDFQLSEEQKTKIDEIQEAAKSHKFARKEIMFELTGIFLSILENDIEKEINILNKSFAIYDEAIQSIPNTVFDPEKVEKLVSKPFKNKEVLVKLYKLQLRDEAYKKNLNLINELNAMSKALEKQHLLHAELLKQKSDKKNTDKLVSELNEILKIENL